MVSAGEADKATRNTGANAPSQDVRVFACPTRVLYGVGSSLELGREVGALGARKCFVVTDAGVARAGIARSVERSIADAGLAICVYEGAVPNPDVESVDAAAAAARAFGADLLVGVGGGSAMDTAKLVGVLLAHDKVTVYEYFKDPAVSKPIVPVVAVPTTAGTGSEVSYTAVVNRKSTSERLSLRSPLLACCLAVLDPTFAAQMPPKLAATTGMDALAHALEGFTSRRACAFGDALAAEAMRLIGRNLVRLVEEPGNLEAASNMLVASTMAGLVLNLSTVGLGHALARPLSTFYGVHHGLANAVVLPDAIAFNLVGNETRFAQVAQLLGVSDGKMSDGDLALTAVEVVREIRRRMGIPNTLSALGVSRTDVARLTDAVLNFPAPLSANPRQVSRSDVESIYLSLLSH